MGTTAFAEWLHTLQSRLGWSDTKLASEIGVSASSISLWKNRGVTPRSEIHLDKLVELSGEDKSKVYALAGRGQVGMAVEGLSPDLTRMAYVLQAELEAIEDPNVREMARLNLHTQIRAWRETLETISEFVKGKEVNGKT